MSYYARAIMHPVCILVLDEQGQYNIQLNMVTISHLAI